MNRIPEEKIIQCLASEEFAQKALHAAEETEILLKNENNICL
jgi:hypothetical protein